MADRRASLRPSGFDELGLRRVLGDRMLSFIVAAMAFLAALGLAFWVGAAALARHWQSGPEAVLTIEVPQPEAAGGDGATRIGRALALLRDAPGVADARIVPQQELLQVLRPWLGDSADLPALPLPGVIAVRLADPNHPTDGLSQSLAQAVPGASVESQGVWVARLARLARSLQACAGASLLALAAVAAAVIAVATRAGIATRREAIEIVHGLGATDSFIAARFARRATGLAAGGALLGAVIAAPVLLALGRLAAPFIPAETARGAGGLMPALWMLLPALPLGAGLIGFLTAQATVRHWLRRLP